MGRESSGPNHPSHKVTSYRMSLASTCNIYRVNYVKEFHLCGFVGLVLYLIMVVETSGRVRGPSVTEDCGIHTKRVKE